jgi:hypothetical protein
MARGARLEAVEVPYVGLSDEGGELPEQLEAPGARLTTGEVLLGRDAHPRWLRRRPIEERDEHVVREVLALAHQ